MAQQTAMQIMYDELIAHEYTIPISLIVKCKELIEMEKEQIIKAHGLKYYDHTDGVLLFLKTVNGEQYYNKTFTSTPQGETPSATETGQS